MRESKDVADSSTGDDSGAVPSVDEMISESVASNNGAHSGDTELEALDFQLVGGDSGATATEQPTHANDEPRRRGRPRKDGSAPAIDRPAAKRKAEIQAELDRVKAELEAERARNDAGKVTELARTIEFASVLLFGAISTQRGPHWKVTPEEAKALGATGAHAAAPYAAELNAKLPWAVFAGQLGIVLMKRYEEDKKLIAQFGVAPAQ